MSGQQSEQMTVAAVVSALQALAPRELAEPWDPVGLQVGDPDDPCTAVLIALDVTPQAICQAIGLGCQLIISHHPLIFHPLETLRRDDPAQRLLCELIERKISVLAAHTNLDVVPGGVADSLAGRLAGVLGADPAETHAEKRTAVDIIGSFAGLLPPSGENDPSKEAVPYAPVAVYGRLMTLSQMLPVSGIAARCRAALGAAGCLFNTDQDRTVRRIAVFPGSFAEDSIAGVRAAGIDCVVCGESKHSTGILLALSGIAQVIVGHDVSERVVLDPLADRLRILLPDILFAVHPGLVYNDIASRVSRTAAGVNRKVTREESPGSKGQGAG